MTDAETLNRFGIAFAGTEDDGTIPGQLALFDEPTNGQVRAFETGATRDTDTGKLAYEGFFSPAVLKRRAEYMHKHRVQSDGSLRDADNWQKGIPFDVYMDSAFRHFMEWWTLHRDSEETEYADVTDTTDDELAEAICALMFNCEGYLHELLKPS